MSTLDLSNHDWATFNPHCLKAAGVDRVILGTWDFTIAETMLLGLRDVGITVEDLYCFIYYRLPFENNDFLNAFELVARHRGIERIWLDCEATFDGPAGSWDSEAPGTTVEDRQRITLSYDHKVEALGLEPGIYTGRFWWRDNMNDWPTFAVLGRKLWLANYGRNDPNDPRPPIEEADFGGWTDVSIHQYSSTIPVCGRNRDHNYWMLEEGDMGAIQDLQKQLNDLKLASFSGQEEGMLSRDERIARADYRILGVVEGAQEPGQIDRSLSQRISNVDPDDENGSLYHTHAGTYQTGGPILPEKED